MRAPPRDSSWGCSQSFSLSLASMCRAIFRSWGSDVTRTKRSSLMYSRSKARNPASSVKAKWGEGLRGLGIVPGL